MSTKPHAERKHSKFSASGAERWLACPGSVHLQEGLPDKETKYSLEGVLAHEVLEKVLNTYLGHPDSAALEVVAEHVPSEMLDHATDAADVLVNLHNENEGSELLVETRVHLKHIHPDMFGTFDGAILDHFGVLHVFDYKYGAGHAVSPTENLQMIFYGLGLAHLYDYNFHTVRLWIIQPRIKGYDGPRYWELSMKELKSYISVFKEGVRRVFEEPETYVEGQHCYFCKAKGICPLKTEGKTDKAKALFGALPL